MKNNIIYIILLLSLSIGTEFNVKPYLQLASPTSINIMWETNNNQQSLVEYGLTPFLGNSQTGIAFTGNGNSYIHDVEITNLEPDTKYHYRVITNDAISEIYNFYTPPSDNNTNFNLVAMSDMQKDYSNFNKFEEIIHEGVLDYFNEHYEGEINQELGMVLIPGDLVENGLEYFQWADHFFGPGEELFSHIPLYPVPGNHENNSNYFFKYFHLPENGSPGFNEHWWYHDYSNVRVIGLDSNGGFQISTQLNWLENVLEESCIDDDVDFVFAQLHHPYKSELWIAGETDFTGDVIALLENFSTACEKPSIHFFGHTHGYSRGQSRDHNHLWVNVATAGGNIDYWDEYAQNDYDEFTVTHDEWGFVIVESIAGNDPSFTLKRISRGNENEFRDNELRDEITIKKFNESPLTPSYNYPNNETVSPDYLMLVSSPFLDPDDDGHGQSHWKVSYDCNDFSNPVFESWKSFQNIYFNEDTQVDDNLEDEEINYLEPNSSYCWTVRYRDKSLKWSQWSTPSPFNTGESDMSGNLVLNPGAEEGINHWTLVTGNIESLGDTECDGIGPHSGESLFAVGGVCENESDFGEAYQLIGLGNFSECIEQELGNIIYGGFLSNWGGSDKPEFQLYFLNENFEEIGATPSYHTYNSSWTLFDEFDAIPVDSKYIEFTLRGTRYAGTDNDSYFDDLFLRVQCTDSYVQGDLNQDQEINIQDVIMMINLILSGDINEENLEIGDMNEDGAINIQDVILLVQIILYN